MLHRVALLAVTAVLLARPSLAAAHARTSVDSQPEDLPSLVDPGPLDGLAHHLARAFSGMNLGFQLAAVAATATMTTQDVDFHVHSYFRDHPDWGRAAYPCAILGVAGPAALFGGLHVVGRATDNVETVGAAYAVLQAEGLAPDEAKLSRTFRPGLYRGGIIAGWPSGHVAITTAALSALVGYYPDSLLLKLATTVGVAGMMLGVTSFEKGGFHWASDAVAGALMAFPIGISTGQGMRALVRGERARPTTAWFLTPSLRADTIGATLGRGF
jgi:hypothetical protein